MCCFLVFNVNMLSNGDGETGPCTPNLTVTSPTGWKYDGDISQAYYNNSEIGSRVNSIPASA